ncbi:MAG TPA: serine/threonine-protein kinase [Gemmataceae bacterium]|nr:serine/threonine-protein kinase [Gemmataceae bacterium]
MVGRVFLGRYEAVRLLGEGGMGKVYLARQVDLQRQVVVKVMHEHLAEDPKFSERFQREMLLMARFQHPYAVTLYDASLNDPKGPCIVMEYIRGVTLDTLLQRNGRLSPQRVGRLLGQLCEVLQAAHSEGIIHRDLKPANLMIVDPDTPYELIKVMDFGLAKLLDPDFFKQVSMTGTDFAIGTPGYMCPEQARGDDMDHRGDLYSVGIILYEMLCGKLPFAGRETMDVMLAHATEPPPPFDQMGAGDWVPATVEAVVRQCLGKWPGERPNCARELAERYETALAHEQAVVEAAAPTDDPRLQPEPISSSQSSGSEGAAAVAAPRVSAAADDAVYHLEAWMPERIAAYKLRGFVQDVGGEVVESVPGRIRVRLGARGQTYAPRGSQSWLSLGRRAGQIDVELHLERADPARDSLLHVTVLMRPTDRRHADEEEWRERSAMIYCDLRGYLMGQDG